MNSTGKYWRVNYRFAGKQKTLAIGVYPEVSLVEARKKRDEAKDQLAKDADPAITKAIRKQIIRHASENTFKAVALERHAKNTKTWAESTSNNIKRCLEKDIFPWLGSRAIRDITAPDLLAVLRKIESRSPQALEILQSIHPLTGNGKYIFPSMRGGVRPMSENIINAALRRMGYEKDEMIGHGFRSMASTLLHEHGWSHEAIERH